MPVSPVLLERLAPYAGPAAGVATSILWTGTSLFFSAGSRRIGPTLVNSLRIWIAAVLLGVTHRLLTGHWVPDAVPQQVLYLGISGVLGLALGDLALFAAFVYIGPRLSSLIMSVAPIFAALFGWVVLGETLEWIGLLGIALTVCGVAWVLADRSNDGLHAPPVYRRRGILLALIGATMQAVGMLLSKAGMGHGWLPTEQHLGPQAAAFVRMFFASLATLPIFLLRQRKVRGATTSGVVPARGKTLRDGLLFTFYGSIIGPFLGMWLSLTATDRCPIGIAQTLISLTPVFILPFSATIHRERIGARAILGTLLAVGGSTLLFLHPK